jgi:hypothetical protein
MNIKFYISDEFSKNYLPFLLYRESIRYIIKEIYNKDIIYIYNINNIINRNDEIILLNIYSINIFHIDLFKKYESKIILINTEYYTHLGIVDIINKINAENISNIYILDYNILNINYYKKNCCNIKWYFIPLCYNMYLENYYNLQITNKINFCNKDIDILFYGTINDRRKKILDILNNKYRVVHLGDCLNNNLICNYIERSKIVLNIFYYEHNKIFDYYRNSFLIANKILLISEKAHSNDYEIEIELLNLEENIILASYENIINTVDTYMNISEDEYYIRVNKQYESFKNYNMTDKVINFFTPFNILNK